MNQISREELRRKLVRGERFELVMTMSAWHYTAKRIPASRHFDDLREALDELDREQEIVVYCSDVHCAASIRAYDLLARNGFERVRRYAGGIADWEAAGYRLESGPALGSPPCAETSRRSTTSSRRQLRTRLTQPRFSTSAR